MATWGMDQLVEAAFSWLRLCPHVDGKLAVLVLLPIGENARDWQDQGTERIARIPASLQLARSVQRTESDTCMIHRSDLSLTECKYAIGFALIVEFDSR